MPVDKETFLLAQLDQCRLVHSTFSTEALGLVEGAADGILRRARKSALGCLLEAVRAHQRVADLDNVNRSYYSHTGERIETSTKPESTTKSGQGRRTQGEDLIPRARRLLLYPKFGRQILSQIVKIKQS